MTSGKTRNAWLTIGGDTAAAVMSRTADGAPAAAATVTAANATAIEVRTIKETLTSEYVNRPRSIRNRASVASGAAEATVRATK